MNKKDVKNHIKKLKSKREQKKFNTIEVSLLMIITCLFGIFIGSCITIFKPQRKTSYINNNQVTKDRYLNEFEKSYNNIVSNYYNEINKEELINSAIEGMIKYLDDPYAEIYNKEDSKNFEDEVNGEYYGIGCEITESKSNFIISKIYKNTPASKSGLKVDDVIVSINDNLLEGEKLESSYKYIKNDGSINKIVVKRNNKEKTFEIKSELISIPSVTSSVKKEKNKCIGYISISVFASNTYEQFRKELEEIEKQKIDSLIIDVRDNNGGYLSSVTNIASMFLKKNKIIYQLKNQNLKEPIMDETKEKREYEIVVLINENSASASEVLALSLKESYGATIVGKKSFGKGTIQKAYKLKDGELYKYTIEEWLSPKGDSINNKGIKPDVIEENYNNQLNKAIEVLTK